MFGLTEIKTRICIHHIIHEMSMDSYQTVMEFVDEFGRAMDAKGQSADHYRKNRAASKPGGDIRLGKYGEYGAAYILHTKFGFPMVMPDVTVRRGYQKKFDCDLPFGETDANYPMMHVKTCNDFTLEFVRKARPDIDDADAYSWTFQYRDLTRQSGMDSLFERPESWEPVALVYTPGLESRVLELVATAPWCLIYPLLQDPIAAKYQGIKKCLYFHDLKQALRKASSPA